MFYDLAGINGNLTMQHDQFCVDGKED